MNFRVRPPAVTWMTAMPPQSFEVNTFPLKLKSGPVSDPKLVHTPGYADVVRVWAAMGFGDPAATRLIVALASGTPPTLTVMVTACPGSGSQLDWERVIVIGGEDSGANG